MVSVGPVIKKDVVDKLAGTADVRAKVATGLARPDVFDWQGELRRALSRSRYDYVVMMLGTNDSQDFVVDGKILAYGSSEWVKVYNARVASMMDLACKGAQNAFWLGLPPMQSPAFARKATRINSWAMRQAKQHTCVTYVSLDQTFADASGRYTPYLRNDGTLEKARMVDGIHITSKGGRLVASLVLDLMQARSLSR
jgi:hypothetical protein